ncbi:MAG: chromosome segregation protein SMC, partial [Nitrospinae bacterium CG11_big_fil_rev_8_21_14_0_20_56_8]
RTVNEKKEDIHSISARMAGDEHAIELKQSNITRAEADIQTADHEIGRMNGEIESLTLETQAQRKELGDLSERINEQGFALEREREARDAARRALSQAENQAREGEAELLAVHQQISQKKNKQTALDTRKQYLADRDLKLEEEQGALRSQLQGLTDQVGLQEEEFGHGQSLLSAAKNERDGLRQQVKEGREKLEALNEAAALVKEDYLAQSSVRTSLVELRRKFEGFQSGVRHLMAGPENGERLPGLREVLVDVLKTPAEYEAAIEAVLGEQLQTIIVDSYSDTVGAIGYLREHQAGRGTFLPVQHKPVSVTTLHLNGNPGVLGKAMDLIECREEYRPVVELLLDSVAVVRDLESAIQLHENPEFHGTVVTQSGEIIDPRGMVTGGAGDNSPGLLAQNRKIEELTARVQVLQGEVESAQNMAGEQKGRVLAWENQLQQIDQDVNARTLTLANAEKDLQQARREIARLGERLSSLDQERTQGAQEVDGLAQQLEMLAAELSEVEAEKARRESGLEGLRSQVEEVRRGLETLSGEIGRIEVLAASLKGKRDNTLTEIKRIELQQENLRHRIQKHDREKTENAARIQSAQEEIRVLEQKILGQAREKDQLSEEVVQEEEALREKEDSLKSMEQETRALARQIQELTEAMSRVELRRSEIKLQITHLEERAFEEFNVILADVIAACANELNEEETREAEERVRELKDKIARMGEVNLAALSEFQQADERYQFLKRQQEDLAESIHLLHETIERINRTTRDRFLETFEKVSTNFKEVFARLFQGGKAELILTDPANPLESGIEISANPMGKIMQNLSLLSGGEKAMTAIALMFSVFKVRPSPFCLLDEVDAPLDEANVIRFQEMLKEMSDKTQFIIITHNQKTMSFADVLYGITMEEKGVSKAVSVTLN